MIRNIEFFAAYFQEVCLYERKNQMIFKLGNIQVPLTGSMADFDGTMMLSKCELALTNSMIQVNMHRLDALSVSTFFPLLLLFVVLTVNLVRPTTTTT